MRQLRGSSQIMSGTLPFAAVEGQFARDLMQKKAVADFVQMATPVSVLAGAGSMAVTLDYATTFNANPTGEYGYAVNADLGYIAGNGAGQKVSKSRAVLRDASTKGPIVDADQNEIYGYLVVVNGDPVVEFYALVNGVETAVTLAAPLDVEYQLMRRFTLDQVGEDFGANEKWAMGIVDTNTALNLQQIAKDLYGANWTLDADGTENLAQSLYDMLTGHINGEDPDAHAADDISWASGTTGINANNVQDAIRLVNERLTTRADEVATAAQDALNLHITGTSAHNADQIDVAQYSGTTGGTMAAADLQTALQGLVDNIRSNYMLIDTHLSEDVAHRARNIEVELSGTTLANHFGTSGTQDLQQFLVDMEAHLHASIDAVSGTASSDTAALEAALAAQSGTFRSDITNLQTDLAAQSGTMVTEDQRLAGLIAAQSGTFRAEVDAVVADVAAQSGTFRAEMDAVVADVASLSGTFRSEMDAAVANNTALSGTFRSEMDAAVADIAALSGTFRSEMDAVVSDVAAQSGTFRSEIDAVVSDVAALSGTFRSEMDAAVADIAAQSGTFRSEVDAVVADVASLSGTFRSEMDAAVANNTALSGTFRSEMDAAVADIASLSGTFRSEMDAVVADVAAQSGTFRSEVDALVSDLAAQSGTLTALDNRMEKLLGITDGADVMAFTGTHIASTDDVTSALEALSAAIIQASDSGGSDTTRLEGIMGVAADATQFGATGTFLAVADTIKEAAQKLDTEITHVMNALGVNTTEAHERSFNLQDSSGTQLTVDNTDTFAVAIDKVRANIARHIVQAEDAHDAAAISFASGTSTINAANVQEALGDIGARVNRLEQESVECEVPTVSNGGATIELANGMKEGHVPLLIINGVVQKYTASGIDSDFSIINATTLNLAVAVEAGDAVYIWYKKAVN